MAEEYLQESPILKGIIWCRQVDNEAESPRYTPSPIAFEGLSESLPRVKTVGDMAINLSDTSDYWDPDPRKRLSFYKNLFLYSAAAGKHICMGRMFLSNEDRPRLGVKTLVMGSKELFASENAARTLHKWYYDMASEPVPSASSVPSTPALTVELARAMTMERGNPDNPVVMALGKEWSFAYDSVFTLLERMPQSLLALSGILLFPYFMPAGNADYSIVGGTFPLSVAIFRMDGALSLEQKKKKLDIWAKKGATVVDLTSPSPKEPKRTSQVIQWLVDDKETQRWKRLRSLVDGEGLEERFNLGPDRDDGPSRRKELARVFAAMGTHATKDKELRKPPRRGFFEREGAKPPTPPTPSIVSGSPPWADQFQRVRVDRAGSVVELTRLSSRSPQLQIPTSPEYVTMDALTRLVEDKMTEHLTRVLTSKRTPEIERLNQELETLRVEVKELDERLKYFAERTLPILKKTWTRIDAIDKKKTLPKGKEATQDVEKLKEEVWNELHRMETELAERSRHILERMELNLQTQGRIWLTLVQQISHLTEQRHGEREERGP